MFSRDCAFRHFLNLRTYCCRSMNMRRATFERNSSLRPSYGLKWGNKRPIVWERKLQIKKKPEKLSFYLKCYHEQHQQMKRKFPRFFPSMFEFLPRCHKTRVHPFAHDFPAISEGSRLQDFSMINCLGTHLMCTGAHWTAKTITVLRF